MKTILKPVNVSFENLTIGETFRIDVFPGNDNDVYMKIVDIKLSAKAIKNYVDLNDGSVGYIDPDIYVYPVEGVWVERGETVK